MDKIRDRYQQVQDKDVQPGAICVGANGNLFEVLERDGTEVVAMELKTGGVVTRYTGYISISWWLVRSAEDTAAARAAIDEDPAWVESRLLHRQVNNITERTAA